MPDLEARRSNILLEIAWLGDFRRGSVHASYRRCGKPNCACAGDGHPGHGHQVRLSTSAAARPSSRRYPIPPTSTRPSARWPPSAASSSSPPSLPIPMSASADCTRPRHGIWSNGPPGSETLRAIQNAVQTEVASLLRV